MTKEDIIRMARESGFCFDIDDPVVYAAHEHLAALHAAHEREECAKVCEAGIIETTKWDASYWNRACEDAAFRIRARGEK